MKILGCDTGLSSFGVAVMGLEPARVLDVRVIRTKKANAKRRIRAADDTADRCMTIAAELWSLVRAHPDLVAICVESTAAPYGKTRTSVVSALGRVRGLLDAIAEHNGLAVVEESPQTLKVLVTGRRDASKENVRDSLEKLFPELADLWPPQKTLQEHAGDAVAACVAGLRSDVVKAAIRARGAA